MAFPLCGHVTPFLTLTLVLSWIGPILSTIAASNAREGKSCHATEMILLSTLRERLVAPLCRSGHSCLDVLSQPLFHDGSADLPFCNEIRGELQLLAARTAGRSRYMTPEQQLYQPMNDISPPPSTWPLGNRMCHLPRIGCYGTKEVEHQLSTGDQAKSRECNYRIVCLP